jgi:hypothetical protein
MTSSIIPQPDSLIAIPAGGDQHSQLMFALGQIVSTQQSIAKQLSETAKTVSESQHEVKNLTERVTIMETCIKPIMEEKRFEARLSVIKHAFSGLIGALTALGAHYAWLKR